MNEVYLVPKDELYHYGVKGMKWGHRKNIYDVNANYYSNRASKLSARANRNRTMASMNKAAARQGNGLISKANSLNAKYYDNRANKLQKRADVNRTMASMNEAASKQRQEAKTAQTPEQIAAKRKKALKVGAAVAGTALAAYGAYKLNKFIKDENVKIARKRGEEAMRQHMEDNWLGARYANDGRVHISGKYTSGITKPVNREQAGKIQSSIHRQNMRIADEGRALSSKEIARARNDSFVKAAKNVYDDRKKRKR